MNNKELALNLTKNFFDEVDMSSIEDDKEFKGQNYVTIYRKVYSEMYKAVTLDAEEVKDEYNKKYNDDNDNGVDLYPNY